MTSVHALTAVCPPHPPPGFEVKRTTKIQKNSKAYADKKNIDVSTLRFNIDWELVVFEQTAGELDLDSDVVNVEMKQVGGQTL
ncbi:hypothetical protein AMAG_00445 [Allomyces macrogynus ATCC 38327]|uniref:Ubiquitin-like domain-containing protein n=1 Tax=Allomyces macrogynus (strain ATCC 38327) TaxID=578462 RepID=A0A0L0RW02_ALLM3|nr:hypothetical protein AMAG_00445 [Allomyces macrogynus ATCC 38327]|eukprot:KNE54473.1 hypothetical protein AMAG_00445 [Allomyces macrogynus ATCC 38327]